jgi:hypothetical protein
MISHLRKVWAEMHDEDTFRSVHEQNMSETTLQIAKMTWIAVKKCRKTAIATNTKINATHKI